MFGCPVFGQASGSDGDSQRRESIKNQQTEFSLACDVAMTNILHELQRMTNQYPPLSDIGLVSIMKNDETRHSVYFRYSKNTHFVFYPENSGLQKAGYVVVDKEGADLDVEINSAPFSLMTRVSYPLIVSGDGEGFWLRYNLELNSPDPGLEKAVKDIIEKQVGIIRK
jgi:hypothetical protein